MTQACSHTVSAIFRVIVALSVGAFLAVTSPAAQAQSTDLLGHNSGPPYVVPIPPAYTGPGDIVSGWTAWYSQARAYSAAVAATGTQKAGDIRRASDNATCSPLIATNGSVDLTVGTPCAGQTVTAFCNATSCLFSKLYDQSGNTGRDASQGTVTNQPQLVFNAQGSLPGLFFVRSASTGLAATIPTTSQPNTWSFVSKRSGSLTSPQLIIGSGTTTDNNEAYYDASNNTITGYAGTNQTVTASDNAFHAFQFVMSGASGVINVDGTAATKNMGTQSTNTLLTIGARPSAYLDGYVLEGGLLPSALSAGNQAVLNANQHAYYGF